jgi:peptidoglycan/xylan/chitin deacetylase (PgdA/CDA1 family)
MIFRSIPVGMYHHVNQNAGDFITVNAEHFRRQMEWLRRENYETFSADSFLAVMRGDHRPAHKSFLITFDDAWLDVHAFAFPILRDLGHKFVIFTVSDWTQQAADQGSVGDGRRDFPTHDAASKLVKQKRAGGVICAWRHLSEMQDSGLCSVESHSTTHRNATAMPAEELREDLQRCREAIRQNLGRESRHHCWPRGEHNRAALQIARESGFDATYLVRRGVNLAGSRSGSAVKRFTVLDRDEKWLQRQLDIFSNPLWGFLYARLKPDRWLRRKS